MASLIRQVVRGAYLYSSYLARAYRKLPLDLAVWPLLCFKVEGRFYTDTSLSFGLRWAASHCHDVTGLVARELGDYIDDLGRGGWGVATTESEAPWHFSILQAMLEKLGLEEAKHKECPPSQVMVWLSLRFNTINMTVSIPDKKLAEFSTLEASWARKTVANIHELHTILSKLFHVA